MSKTARFLAVKSVDDSTVPIATLLIYARDAAGWPTRCIFVVPSPSRYPVKDLEPKIDTGTGTGIDLSTAGSTYSE